MINKLSVNKKTAIIDYIKQIAKFIALKNMQKSIRSIFDKIFEGFMIDNMAVKREISLCWGIEEKVLFVGQKNLEKKNYSF